MKLCRGWVMSAGLVLAATSASAQVSNGQIVVPDEGGHQLALAVIGEQVMGDAVALAGRAITVERDRALAVEVHRGLVAVDWSAQAQRIYDIVLGGMQIPA